MINSVHNPWVKQIAGLSGKKGRDMSNAFLVEGETLITEIPPGWRIRHLIVSEAYTRPITANAEKTTVCSARVFQKLSDTVTPQGILAVCEKKTLSLDEVLARGDFFLMAERLSDPGNAGAMIRTAEAAGAGGLILTGGSVDIYNPKVVRSAAGSLFRLPIVENADPHTAIARLKEKGVQVLAAHLKGSVYPYALDLTKPCCLLIGNEANGLSDETACLVDKKIKIPMPGGAESLNASVAGGILLYEVVRQRLFQNNSTKAQKH